MLNPVLCFLIQFFTVRQRFKCIDFFFLNPLETTVVIDECRQGFQLGCWVQKYLFCFCMPFPLSKIFHKSFLGNNFCYITSALQRYFPARCYMQPVLWLILFSHICLISDKHLMSYVFSNFFFIFLPQRNTFLVTEGETASLTDFSDNSVLY